MPKKGRYYWLKLEETFFNSKKIKKALRQERGHMIVIVYLKLLLAVLNTNGYYTSDSFNDDLLDEIAIDIDETIEDVKIAIAYLEHLRLIEPKNDDSLFFPAIEEMVGYESSSAGRMRKYRQRHALVSPSDASPSHCDEERDSNLDIDKSQAVDADVYREGESDQSNSSSLTLSFTPPSVAEVTEYCTKNNININPDRFVTYYQGRMWKVNSGEVMSDWRAVARSWSYTERGSISSSTTTTNSSIEDKPSFDLDKWYDMAENTDFEELSNELEKAGEEDE